MPEESPRSARAAAVLVAAGASARMARGGVAGRKVLLELDGVTVLEHACRALDAAPSVVEIVLVAHADDVDRFQRMAAERPALAKVRAVVAGGAERVDSVRLGAGWCGRDLEVTCVHDAARPLVRAELVEAVIARAAERGAALAAIPVRDTIKVAAEGGSEPAVERTLDRARLWAAQTPQAFRAGELREVLARAEQEGFRPTDDAALWERYRGPVAVVEGSSDNLKVTSPADLELAAALLAARAGARGAGSTGDAERASASPADPGGGPGRGRADR